MRLFGSGSGAIASQPQCSPWGLSRRPKVIEVTTPHKGRTRRAHIHSSVHGSHPQQRTEVGGIPSSTVVRLLVDVGIPWGDGFAGGVWTSGSDRPCQRPGGGFRTSIGWRAEVATVSGRGRVLIDRLVGSSLTDEPDRSRVRAGSWWPPDRSPRTPSQRCERNGAIDRPGDFVFEIFVWSSPAASGTHQPRNLPKGSPAAERPRPRGLRGAQVHCLGCFRCSRIRGGVRRRCTQPVLTSPQIWRVTTVSWKSGAARTTDDHTRQFRRGRSSRAKCRGGKRPLDPSSWANPLDTGEYRRRI